MHLHLNRPGRLERIGLLLAKGVALMLLEDARQEQAAQLHFPVQWNVDTDSGSGQREDAKLSPPIPPPAATCPVVEFLRRARSASPRDIQSALGMSKASVFRRLDAFVKSGCVVRSGKTTTVRYRLVTRLSNSRTPTYDQNSNVFQKPVAVGREPEKTRK